MASNGLSQSPDGSLQTRNPQTSGKIATDMAGRELTSFGPSASLPGVDTPPTTTNPDSLRDKALYIPDATDLIYHALQAEQSIDSTIPTIFTDALAIDNARFAGEGASFTVYRRHIPPQKKHDVVGDSGEGWSVSTDRGRPIPSVVAYKVPRVEFDHLGRPFHSTRHAMRATVMELYLTTNPSLVKHNNIVDFVGLAWGTNPFDSFHKTPVLMVEYSERGSLSHVLRQQYYPLSTRCKLASDICHGVRALHECNVVHGDLKGENILVFDSAEGLIAKVSDFGYSHVLECDEPDLSIGGTRPWQAPETQAKVLRENAKATDVYSLSLLVWCILAHGINVFELVGSTKPSIEERYVENETFKRSGELLRHTNIEHWYTKAIALLIKRQTHPEIAFTADLGERMRAQLTSIAGSRDIMAAVNEAENTAFLIYTCAPPVLPGLLAVMGKAGFWPQVTNAITQGLSMTPTDRKLDALIDSFGGDTKVTTHLAEIKTAPWKHTFQWTDWPRLPPWLQRYLSTVIERRRETEWEKSLINPPEALLLTTLYTNGYGLDRDREKAIQWMGRAMRAGLQTASTYSYRLLTGLGFTLDDPRSSVPMLEHMALRGSRTALEDLKQLHPEKYLETRQKLRDSLAGVGANFFFVTEMVGRNEIGMWQATFRDIDKTLPLFEQMNDIGGKRVNQRGDGVLHVAASCGFANAISVLLDKFTNELKVNQLNGQGETPLLCACRAGQLDTALTLIQRGADAGIAATNGETPLHWSISFDETEVQDLLPALFTAGADPAKRTDASISYCVNLQSGFRPDRHSIGYPVAWATECNRPDIVKVMLDHTPDPTICAQSWPRVNSAIEIAVSFYHAECLRLMIDSIKKFNLHQGRAEHQSILVTPLIQNAAFHSDLFNMCIYHGAEWKSALRETLRILLPMSNPVFTLDGYEGHQGVTLFYWAIWRGRDELVEYLLNDAWSDMKAGDRFDEEKILSSSIGAYKPTHVNKSCGSDDMTPFLEAVRWARPRMMKRLLEHGAIATIAARNPFNGETGTWSAVHVLAHAGHEDPELLKLILDQGVPVDGLTPDTETPLLLAIQNDKMKMAEQLLRSGADPNASTTSFALQTLAHPTTILGHIISLNSRNSVPRLRFLLTNEAFASRIDHIVEPERQWTALHRCAAGHLHARFRDTRTTQGQDLPWSDIDWDANVEVMTELLFRLGQHIDAVESNGNTALHVAIQAGNPGAARLLMDRGAKADIVNADGEDASMLALRLWAETLSIAGDGRMLPPEQAARKECADLLAAG